MVKASLSRVEGVYSVEVSMERDRAVVRFDPGRARIEDLREAAARAGFRVTSVKILTP
ncbi:MAG: heavy-metal-associated domain-containing protein [Firmicutes bacterium]|nr:heavy-metal-associated domain-containing protein [Bacillota bacterium]